MRNDALALAGFRVMSPRSPEGAPFLAQQQHVDAVVIGNSIEAHKRRTIIEAIRRLCPECLIVFVYADGENGGEPLADVEVEVTDGLQQLIEELQHRLPRI